jgi:hypothetical protein
MKAIPLARLVSLAAMVFVTTAASAVTWDDYPGNIDMGGWRIARNSSNHAEVVLLGPPGGKVIVGGPTEPLVGFLFLPDEIFAHTQTATGDNYYVIQRDWPTSSQLGEQRVVKLSGPLTLAQLNANPTWKDEIEGMPFTTPQGPPKAIFWKKPGIVILYSIVALWPLTLLVGVLLLGIIVFLIGRRRRHARRGGPILP